MVLLWGPPPIVSPPMSSSPLKSIFHLSAWHGPLPFTPPYPSTPVPLPSTSSRHKWCVLPGSIMSSSPPHSLFPFIPAWSPLIYNFQSCAPVFTLASTPLSLDRSANPCGTVRRPPHPKSAELTGKFPIPKKKLLRWLVVVKHHLHHKWKAQIRTRDRSILF